MNIAYELASLIISGLQQNSKLRFWVTLISGILVIGSLTLLFTAEYFIFPVAEGIRQIMPATSGAFALMLLLALASFAPINIKSLKDGNFDLDLSSIREERKEIKRRISQSPKDVVGTIQLSLNQLTEYYAINKNQARSSFSWSVFAIVVGFITLIGGVWLFYLQEKPNVQLTTITSIASILAEFIGAAYFFIYTKSLSQLNFFFSQLVRLQDTMLAIKLMEDMKDDAKQDEMRRKLIMAIISRPSNGPPIIEKVENNIDQSALQ